VLSIVSHFESLIAKGELKHGDKIATERELAIEYDISRTTVREAIYELELKGLVERVRRRGTTVTDLGGRELMSEALVSGLSIEGRRIAEILDFRAAIEPAIAARAARYATAGEIQALEDLLEKMAQPATAAEHLELNTVFHEMIASATHNPLFVNVAKEISKSLAVLTRQQLRMPAARRSKLMVEGHRAFVDAIRNRDPDTAYTVAQAHVEEVQKQVHRTLSRNAT
jgi:GntR family transcriptional repressor for pyruvate dehydrogenase complex